MRHVNDYSYENRYFTLSGSTTNSTIIE